MEKLGWRGAWRKSKFLYRLVAFFMVVFWVLVFTTGFFSVTGALGITAFVGFVYVVMFFDEKKQIRCSCGAFLYLRNNFCSHCGKKNPFEK